MKGRFSNTPSFNPNATQEIRKTLIEAGRQDLADGIIMRGMVDLEEGLVAQLKDQEERIKVIESKFNDSKRVVSETGVHRILKEEYHTNLVDWGSVAAKGAIGLCVSILFMWLGSKFNK